MNSESKESVKERELVEKQRRYPFGFTSPISSRHLGRGVNEQVIRKISEEREEPEFLLRFRLRAYALWKKMREPHWGKITYESLDYEDMVCSSFPEKKKKLNSLEEVDPEILHAFEKLGIPLAEQKRIANVAVDAVFDSVSILTTFREELRKAGVLFCSMGEAAQEYPDLLKKYLGTVVPPGDNFFAALNSAVFSDGSFVFIPKGVHCPMDLSTYFRINDQEAGQFERTLIIVEKGGSVSYLEGCTAPAHSRNQLHAAVVELIALDQATIKYSTVQNWYPGDRESGKGGVYNFVTKRGKCAGESSKISWVQVEVGAAKTWKYPSCILQGKNSVGEFYSVAMTSGQMEADTGTKMFHIGPNTRSKIISKGISADCSANSYRGLVEISPRASNARNITQCDSMLIENRCSAHTFPRIRVKNESSRVEHEATVSQISEDQLYYLRMRGLSAEEAMQLVVLGFCREVLHRLPLEFATEADQLLSLKLSQSVG